MKQVLIIMAVAWLAGPAALGSNLFSVVYTGDALPESEPGWYRAYNHGGDVRTIETDPDDPNNHFLKIDSLASSATFDYAWYPRQMDPDGPLERFRAEWKVATLEHHVASDQGVDITSDNGNDVAFYHGYDYIRVRDGTSGWTLPVEPGVFHTYRVDSANMGIYRLWIDGQFVHQGPFFEGTGSGGAAFGDLNYGGGERSLANWDYFTFEVYQVPEPVSAGLVLSLCASVGRRRK